MSNETILDNETETVANKPDEYVAVAYNDDYTTFDMVIYILMSIFHQTNDRAMALATEIHKSGKAVISEPYPFDVCDTKCSNARQLASYHDMPFMVEPVKV